MPLSDAQRRAIALIRIEGGMECWQDAYWVGERHIPRPVAQALIAGKYVEPDAERNQEENALGTAHAARVFHYRLTGKDEDESEDDA